MKRLYRIRLGDDLQDEFFDDKKTAKKRRYELREQGYDAFVTRGPDHRKGERQDQNITVGKGRHDDGE